MATTPGEQQYMAGYNAGRGICLRTGSSEAGRLWVADSTRTAHSAYVAGYDWALWDYDDANGMTGSIRERTTG
jgi:hypothetical protein